MKRNIVGWPKSTDAVLLRLLDLLSQIAHRVLPWLLLVVALYLLNRTVGALNRQETPLGAWIALMGNVQATRFFAFVFGVSGMLYGLHQRNLRRAAVTRLEGKIEELAALLERSAPSTHSPAASDSADLQNPS